MEFSDVSPVPPVLTHTTVVVVGAGPAGLVVANRLHDNGVGCVLLEAETREFIEQRPRAGFLEEGRCGRWPNTASPTGCSDTP